MTAQARFSHDSTPKPVLWGTEQSHQDLWHSPPAKLRRPGRIKRDDHLQGFRADLSGATR
jgi:hypothetical protein